MLNLTPQLLKEREIKWLLSPAELSGKRVKCEGTKKQLQIITTTSLTWSWQPHTKELWQWSHDTNSSQYKFSWLYMYVFAHSNPCSILRVMHRAVPGLSRNWFCVEVPHICWGHSEVTTHTIFFLQQQQPLQFMLFSLSASAAYLLPQYSPPLHTCEHLIWAALSSQRHRCWYQPIASLLSPGDR